MGSANIEDISDEEVKDAPKFMSNNKAPGEDNIRVEVVKETEDIVVPKLTKLYNMCIEKGTILENWNNTILILYKKGDQKSMLQNY